MQFDTVIEMGVYTCNGKRGTLKEIWPSEGIGRRSVEYEIEENNGTREKHSVSRQFVDDEGNVWKKLSI